MKVFLDANILFSGALPRSRMGEFLAVLCKRCECVTNAYAAEEARRNLEQRYPQALPRLELLLKNCGMVPALETGIEVELALKDVPILGGAVAARADYLLTGDEKDFGRFFGKRIKGVMIVPPGMLARELGYSQD